MSTTKRGLFIVFEGIDRVGKSTNCKLLRDYLCKNVKTHLIRFPDRKSLTGKSLDLILKGESSTKSLNATHLLFVANRWESMPFIEATLDAGENIICDRYSYSGMAYSCANGLDYDWCLNAEKGIIKPDIIIYLYTEISSLKNRDGFGLEIYENSTMLEKVRNIYSKLIDNSWIKIEAVGSIDQVFEKVKSEVENKIALLSNFSNQKNSINLF